MLTGSVQSSLNISLFKEKHYKKKTHEDAKWRQMMVPQSLSEPMMIQK